jgi:Carboxypeptidase regulatory-like domain
MRVSPGVLFVALFATFSMLMYGQSATGDITGTVTDPTGASVAAAQVVLTNTETSTDSTAATNADGRYSFVRIKPGTIRLP